MRNDKKRQSRMSFLGYILFFVTIAFTVTSAVLIYAFVAEKSGGNVKWIAGVMLASIFIIAFVCTICDAVRRKIMVEKPLKDILDATERITAGDFATNLQVTHAYGKYDEYDLIKENLNKMSAELSRTEVLKVDFVSNVSHEIKTPLSIIQSYATALQSEKLDKQTRDKYTNTLVSASRRLTELVVNILKLNKLENQELSPENEQIELGEMLKGIILQFEELIDDKQLSLECDIDDLSVRSSARNLEIVWNNLLSNAIKFTPDGGKIAISLKEIDGQATVRIADSGCGISPEVGAHIFEKFYQG
ncbi:MAG: HAMP domain-containing sensor histidine kinase, partial [Clostridia bacterium]